jgi:hypothetical protein
MNRFLYSIFFVTISCRIIASENSDESYSPKDDSSSQDISEYNPFPKNKLSKKRNGSPLFKKKEEINCNNTEISFNNNSSLFNDISYLFSANNINNTPSQDTYHYFYQDVIGSPWNNNNNDHYLFSGNNNNNTSSHSFFPDLIDSPWNTNNNDYLVKKRLLRENIINHTRSIKPSKKWKKEDLKQKNKKDKEIIIKNNTHIKKEDLEKCFEILEKTNADIPIAQAIYESQKRYDEKK